MLNTHCVPVGKKSKLFPEKMLKESIEWQVKKAPYFHKGLQWNSKQSSTGMRAGVGVEGARLTLICNAAADTGLSFNIS